LFEPTAAATQVYEFAFAPASAVTSSALGVVPFSRPPIPPPRRLGRRHRNRRRFHCRRTTGPAWELRWLTAELAPELATRQAATTPAAKRSAGPPWPPETAGPALTIEPVWGVVTVLSAYAAGPASPENTAVAATTASIRRLSNRRPPARSRPARR
jgi:hypothetical protein